MTTKKKYDEAKFKADVKLLDQEVETSKKENES